MCVCVITGRNPQHLLQLSLLDFVLMRQVKLPVDKIQSQSNKFATVVENEVTGDLKLDDRPEMEQ